MSRAEWRRRGDDPATALGWWWRGVWERRVLLLALLPFAVCGAIGRVGGGWGWFALAAANFAFLMARPARASDRLRALLPDPPPPGQFRAQVAYRRDGVTTGRDEMALTVVDGWLYAEGLRSHFALRPEDVATTPGKMGEDYALALTDGSKVVLNALEDRDRRALEGWRKYEKRPEGEPTFPPARVHPREVARRGAWLWFSIMVFGLVSPAMIYLPKGVAKLGIVVLVFGIGFGIMAWVNRGFSRLIQIEEKARDASAEVERTIEDGRPAQARDTYAG